MSEFTRFPTWMWRNQTMPPFLTWLRHYNDHLPPEEKIGFYGLDLYSLNASMQAVIDYLSQVDKESAKRAKQRYQCFDTMTVDPQTYGYLANFGIKKSCMQEVVEQLIEMQHDAYVYLKKNGIAENDEYFFATQNARLVKDAEKYYRAMFASGISSWNVRDTHMAETVNVLADHLENRSQKPAKIIIWAHNSHVGDARATEMGERGELNIGQLIREIHSPHTYSIRFSTYAGEVTAASGWDAPIERKSVMPGLQGSYEALFHKLEHHQFFLDLINHEQLNYLLKIPRLQRAIGVIYRSETERASHYFLTRLPYHSPYALKVA